jgi:hypothetical protein
MTGREVKEWQGPLAGTFVEVVVMSRWRGGEKRKRERKRRRAS